MSLSFPPIKNSPSVSSVYHVSDSNSTGTVEVSSASVTGSTPITPIVSNDLDGDGLLFPLQSRKTG